FFNEKLLIEVTRSLSVVFILGGIAAQFRAQLARNLQFAKLVQVDVIPGVLGFLSAVVLAYAGFGIWALVWQQLVISASGLILAVLLSKWKPTLPRKTQGMKPLLKYGIFLT